MKLHHLLAASILISLPGAQFTHADWTGFRNGDGQARAAEFQSPENWPKDLKQAWKVTVGEGVATPALVDGKIYVFSRQDGKEILRCIDAASGQETWKDQYDVLPANGPAASFSGPRSSPAVSNGKIVTLGLRGMLSCFDQSTGKRLWRKDDFQSYPNFFVSSSPIIIKNDCIALLGGRGNGALACYDMETGQQKWKLPTDTPSYASLCTMKLGDQTLIIAETDRQILAVDSNTGKSVWSIPFAVQGQGYNAASPLVDANTLVIGGSNRPIKAFSFSTKEGKVIADPLWSNDKLSIQFATPIIKDKFLYGLTSTNELFCISMKDGSTQWQQALAGAANAGQGAGNPGGANAGGGRGGPGGGGGRGGRGGGRGGYGTIVDAGKVLLALTPNSPLIVFSPSDKSFTETARLKVSATPTYAYPIAFKNQLLIKDQDSIILYSIN